MRARNLFVPASLTSASELARIPVAAVLAGGHAEQLMDTVAIHVGTVRAAIELLTAAG
ncbi:MAG: hypothetical protein HY647_08515 [Acidobacteria bacterium]|nr:hypothetical protein [Acidobacteriota bacterium]